MIVTAPPSVPQAFYLPYCTTRGKIITFKKNDIYDALAVAGIVDITIKQYASISGAKCGCQAEMGVVCSMAAVALSSVFCPDINIVECAVPLPLPYRRKTSAKFLSTKSWK